MKLRCDLRESSQPLFGLRPAVVEIRCSSRALEKRARFGKGVSPRRVSRRHGRNGAEHEVVRVV